MVLVRIPKGTTNRIGISLEDGGGVNRHSPPGQLVDAQRPPRVQAQKKDGAAILKLKLAKEIASIDQDPHFLVLLDIRKAYDTLDQYLLLITLEGFGAGPWLCGILETFWDCHHEVPS